MQALLSKRSKTRWFDSFVCLSRRASSLFCHLLSPFTPVLPMSNFQLARNQGGGMAQTSPESAKSHWSKLLDGMQAG